MKIEKKIIRKDSLEKLFEKLKGTNREVFAPRSKNGKLTYHPVDKFSDIAAGYIQTTQSSKEVSFPRTEKILDYSKNAEGMQVKGIDPSLIPDIVLWGVRPCDTMGIGQLSSIFNWD